jgi:hypothetical protein
MKPADVRQVHTRPATIQNLEWTPESAANRLMGESIRQIRFSFYNGQLFKMNVAYDYNRTDGLTTDDVIEAISSVYGKGTVPAIPTMVIVSGTYFEDQQKVLALWEDSENAYSLYRSAYGSGFGLVIVSKARDKAAVAAAAESVIIERSEAPQKELERKAAQDQERLEALAKARLINKPRFRP